MCAFTTKDSSQAVTQQSKGIAELELLSRENATKVVEYH